MSWRYMSARETFQGEEVWTIREVYDGASWTDPIACVFPLVALVALLGVGLLAVATHTISLPTTDPED